MNDEMRDRVAEVLRTRPIRCGSCGDRATTSVVFDGIRVPACLRHFNVWETPDFEAGLRGCYICQPDNPDASPEGCDDCDREWQGGVLLRERYALARDVGRLKRICTREHPPKMGSPTKDWTAGTETTHPDGARCVLLEDGDYALLPLLAEVRGTYDKLREAGWATPDDVSAAREEGRAEVRARVSAVLDRMTFDPTANVFSKVALMNDIANLRAALTEERP